MAAGYHSNRQHSDGCFLGIVQNIVGCCCCCDGSTDEEEEKKTDIEKKGKGGGGKLESINMCRETKRRPERKMNRE